MILGRRGKVELEEDARHVLLDCARRDKEPVGDRLIRVTLGHELEHLALTRSQERERVVPAASTEELGDDGGVESGASFRDATHGRRELVGVRHTIRRSCRRVGTCRGERMFLASCNSRKGVVTLARWC